MVPECVDMEAVHCGYCWPEGNHWSRRTEMGESEQCHSTRARFKMDHTVFPANKSTGLWPDNPISLNTVLG